MTAPVRCWLVRRGTRVDTFTTTISLTDWERSTEQLRAHLRGAIRADGANPAISGAHYCLDVARTDQADPTVTTVRLP